MVPCRDVAAEDLGQEAGVHSEQRSGHMVEDADGTHAERQMHHLLTLRSHGVVLGFVHRDVAGPEVVVALEATGGVAHKLHHASAAADAAVRQQHRHAGLMLHVLHRLREHGLRVRGAAAVQLRGDATIGSQARHGGLEAQDLRSHDVARVVVERDALRADHISGHATDRIRRALLDEALHARGVDDGGRRCQGLRLHQGGRGRETELLHDTNIVVENP
mmetsp:Transcript_67054/g.173691  ORF Transcript_67054/g.173691 Transcript_67054/m.173691 type:complete len:219 (-) Transcript_67054:909-1565(-)